MNQGLQITVIDKVKKPLGRYNETFRHFLDLGREIDKTLQEDAEILSDIRKKFDNLSASVEVEFEGISVFDQEIKRTKNLLEQSITRVNESLAVSNRISQDLKNISQSLDRIHADGIQLEDIIKNISIVSDSIEIASRNAGITAFHAGKQGRGFDIIAREMTTLMRSVQEPTNMIPEVSEEIIKGTVDLGHDLSNISSRIIDLEKINKKFSDITDELLSLIPTIELGLKRISRSVEAQKVHHRLLVRENEKSAHWLNDIYDSAHSSAILEISLGAMFRRVNAIRESLVNVVDSSNFRCLYNALKIALVDAANSYDKISNDLISKDVGSLDVQSSERSILQLVSESNQLYDLIQGITNEIKDWLKTNEQSCDMLAMSVTFYEDSVGILSMLNGKLSSLKEEAGKIETPLLDLRKITERSKVLGLYAGIESARGGEYSSSLDFVTKEIKELSEKTTSFVDKIGELQNDMSRNFVQLASYLIKSMTDVEQGISSLQSAIDILQQNKEVLINLNNLSQEMITSTEKMKTYCIGLSEQIRTLNKDYQEINGGFMQYSDTINSSAQTSRQVLDIINQYEKDVSILEKRYRTVVFRQSVEPIILDPANKTDARSHEIIEQIFIGLLTFDSSNHLVPGIAGNFSVSKDGRIWDFTLKKGVKFHNGNCVNAKDVIGTVSRVKNGHNISFVDYVEDVILLDENRLRFVLAFPYLPFLANLACGICDITPHDFSVDNPIGAGPYRFIHWDKNKEIVLEAFEDFFDGQPPIDRVIMKIIPDNSEAVVRFKRGEISIMQLSPDTFKEFESEEIMSGPGLSTQYVGFNVLLDTPFKNKKVRQAMNYAINKHHFAQVSMEGQAVPASGIFPPGMYVYNKNLLGYRFDIDKAKTLMKEAGYGGGIDGTFPLDVRDSEVAIRRAEYIRDCLKKIGITLTINPLPWKEFLERGYRGESLLSLKSWVSDNGDPDNFLYPLFHSKSCGRAGNTSFYQNQEVDDRIRQARAERNSKKRSMMYQEIEEMIIEDAPWMFLSHGVDSYAVNRNIGGFKVDPFGIIRFRYLWSS